MRAPYQHPLYALLCGAIFGAGLLVSGMSDPANVIAFLDLAGRWNPALAFVMGGAIAVAAPAYAWVRRRGHTLGGQPARLPGGAGITTPLVVGSLVFGVGWGLAGLCPGPAVVLAAMGGGAGVFGLVFTIAMLAGLVLARLATRSSP